MDALTAENSVAENSTRAASARAASARAHVHAVVRDSKTSFYWGMRILPKERREAMFAVYAFCREVDDIADEGGSKEDKLTGLAEWRNEINRLFEGAPQSKTGYALLGPVKTYDLQKEDFFAIIDGMEMDARESMCAPSMIEFELYCARVAGAVGLLSTRIFGDSSPSALKHALALGHALQTTNILRDIYEDAARGRLYLPREILEAQGVFETDPKTVLVHPALEKVCAELTRRARNHFAEAESILKNCNRRALRPARIMGAIYRRILDLLEARGWEKLDQSVHVPKLEKIQMALRHGIF